MVRKSSVLDPILSLGPAGLRSMRRSYLCLLNAIMALGSSVVTLEHQVVDAEEEDGNIFFHRAVELSPWIQSDNVNLETGKPPQRNRTTFLI